GGGPPGSGPGGAPFSPNAGWGRAPIPPSARGGTLGPPAPKFHSRDAATRQQAVRPSHSDGDQSLTPERPQAPAVIDSDSLTRSIQVEQLTCTIGAELGNVNLGVASRDPEL